MRIAKLLLSKYLHEQLTQIMISMTTEKGSYFTDYVSPFASYHTLVAVQVLPAKIQVFVYVGLSM